MAKKKIVLGLEIFLVMVHSYDSTNVPVPFEINQDKFLFFFSIALQEAWQIC